MKTVHIATTGSEYHRVNGVTFRISDHSQPSHYQMKNYYDVNSIDDIDTITSNPLFSFYANPVEKDGIFFNAIYNEDRDGFDMNEVSNSEYLQLIVKIEEKKQFMLSNGWKGEITF
jgi:hypothetical protein